MSRVLLIKNGMIVDPSQELNSPRDLLIRDGRIAEIGTDLQVADAELFDAAGLIVAPGFIDLHVHLREPGFEYKETIESGARAAEAGTYANTGRMNTTSQINARTTKMSWRSPRSWVWR